MFFKRLPTVFKLTLFGKIELVVIRDRGEFMLVHNVFGGLCKATRRMHGRAGNRIQISWAFSPPNGPVGQFMYLDLPGLWSKSLAQARCPSQWGSFPLTQCTLRKSILCTCDSAEMKLFQVSREKQQYHNIAYLFILLKDISMPPLPSPALGSLQLKHHHIKETSQYYKWTIKNTPLGSIKITYKTEANHLKTGKINPLLKSLGKKKDGFWPSV